MKLQTAPFSIDADTFAKGLFDLFTDDERVILRFGMLPAEKMQVVETALRNKFLENATAKDGDLFTYIYDDGTRREIGDFSMKALVSEAMHEIAVALYKIGDLVV